MRRSILAGIALFALSVRGQTVTVVDGAGDTVVQVITTAGGLPTTRVIETITTPDIATTSTTTSALPTVTPTTVQQGPVGQPAATVGDPNGVTPYTYTTVIGGVTQAVSDNFTPTNPPTLSPTIGSSGSVMDYSAWSSMYGAQTTAGAAVNAAAGDRLLRCSGCLVSVVAGLVVAILG